MKHACGGRHTQPRHHLRTASGLAIHYDAIGINVEARDCSRGLIACGDEIRQMVVRPRARFFYLRSGGIH